MSREEIYNKIIQHFRAQVNWIKQNPNRIQQFQLGSIYSLFPYGSNEPAWEHDKICSIAREIIQEFENNAVIYEGQAGGMGDMSQYPWFTITEYGVDMLLKEDWLPYDPDGYLKELKLKTPDIDDITLTYIGESIAAYNRRHLLSTSLTMGVASENLMLLLIEAYLGWLSIARRAGLQKKIEGRFISTQYQEFKKEFVRDIKSMPKEFQADWETYLDGIFNFIRLNRNDAGHPTGRKFDVKTLYASLQVFAEYAQFVFKLMNHFNERPQTS